MDYVAPIEGARIKVTINGTQGYVAQAALPWEELGFKPKPGTTYRADVGVTHGNPAGRTRLRTYWSNQQTGIVDDVGFEPKMEPRLWGEVTFE
jgi:hypothetical protein